MLGVEKLLQWLFEAETAVCGALSGGSSEIHTSGLRSDCCLM
jgi:hypothetical protein